MNYLDVNPKELILLVNQKLKQGLSIKAIERELNMGKDTLRQKLNRANYKYDRDLKQFTSYNIPTTHDITYDKKQHITHDVTQDITNSKASNNLSDDITQEPNKCLTQRAITDDDFDILFKIIDNHEILFKILNEYNSKDKVKIKSIELPANDKEITTRSFRSYKSVFEAFSKYCKDNELNQKDAVAKALLNFISE